MSGRLARVVVGVAALGWAPGALACAVCGGDGLNQQAYRDMTFFLSALPLTLLGGFGFVLWRLHRAAGSEPDGRE